VFSFPVAVRETTFTGRAALLGIRFYFAYGWVVGQLDECDLGQNNVPPYLHWLVVCRACRQLTLGRALTPCAPIVRFSSNEVVKCSSCSDVRQYLAAQFFLGPFPAPVPPTSPVPRHRYAPYARHRRFYHCCRSSCTGRRYLGTLAKANGSRRKQRATRQEHSRHGPQAVPGRGVPPRPSVASLVTANQWCCVM
jgi:hypothetical protein